MQEENPQEKPPQDTYTPLKTLRTFQGDMENRIHTKNESEISIVSAQLKSNKKIPEIESLSDDGESRIKTILLSYSLLPIFGTLIIVFGISIIGGVYYYTHLNRTPIQVTIKQTLLPYTAKSDVTLSTNNITSQINDTFKKQIQTLNQNLGSLLYLHFVQKISGTTDQQELSGTDFFKTIAPSANSILQRSFNDTYMSGIYSSEVNSPFIILSSTDYGQTFSGMLSWEPNMKDDLSGIFTNLPKTNIGSSTPPWQDETLNNRDMRVLRDENGTTVLVYGFFDKNTLAIVPNEKIFLNLATKYTNNKLVH